MVTRGAAASLTSTGEAADRKASARASMGDGSAIGDGSAASVGTAASAAASASASARKNSVFVLFAGRVYFGNNGNENNNNGGGIYECTPNNGNWETTPGVTCSLVVLDQALNDRNDGLNCLPAMTGDNPFTQFTD